MNATTYSPSVRLVVAGYASIGLLAWIGFAPDAIPVLDPRQFSAGGFISGGLALVPLVILFRVFLHGPAKERWLAGLISLFPAGVAAIEAVAFLLGFMEGF